MPPKRRTKNRKTRFYCRSVRFSFSHSVIMEGTFFSLKSIPLKGSVRHASYFSSFLRSLNFHIDTEQKGKRANGTLSHFFWQIVIRISSLQARDFFKYGFCCHEESFLTIIGHCKLTSNSGTDEMVLHRLDMFKKKSLQYRKPHTT